MSLAKLKRDHYGYLFIAPFIIGFLIWALRVWKPDQVPLGR